MQRKGLLNTDNPIAFPRTVIFHDWVTVLAFAALAFSLLPRPQAVEEISRDEQHESPQQRVPHPRRVLVVAARVGYISTVFYILSS
jgi:hypothetical protein